MVAPFLLQGLDAEADAFAEKTMSPLVKGNAVEAIRAAEKEYGPIDWLGAGPLPEPPHPVVAAPVPAVMTAEVSVDTEVEEQHGTQPVTGAETPSPDGVQTVFV